jgi:hypothetical protein
MLSDHYDSAHRVTVGHGDLFWANHVIVFWVSPTRLILCMALPK